MMSCARCQVILGLPQGHVSTLWVAWAGHHDRPSTRVNLCPRCDTELLTFLRERGVPTVIAERTWRRQADLASSS